MFIGLFNGGFGIAFKWANLLRRYIKFNIIGQHFQQATDNNCFWHWLSSGKCNAINCKKEN